MRSMERYPRAAVERAMKIREVMLRAIARKITWFQAAEILGITDRHLRRWRERFEEGGFEGLIDRWSGCWGYTGISISTSTCGIFTRSCARSTISSSATRG